MFEVGRGGPQQIPRPPGVAPGGPAPWAHLDEGSLHLDLDTIAGRFAGLGPAIRSPREPLVDRASAVLAALYEHDGETWVVLTRRSGSLRVHRGEVSFPGGGQEPGEALWDTALREANEEVGLRSDGIELIGELDHLSTITSNSFIVPFVATLPGRPDLVASPAEVDAVLHVALSELLMPEVYREERWDILGTQRSIFFFDLFGDTVWGATAAMLRQLLGLSTGVIGRGQLAHD